MMGKEMMQGIVLLGIEAVNRMALECSASFCDESEEGEGFR